MQPKFYYMRTADGRLHRTAKQYTSPPRRMRPKAPEAEEQTLALEDLVPIYIPTSTGEMLPGDSFTWAMPSDIERRQLAGEGVVARAR